MKRIATHVHCAPMSGCAQVPAEEIPARYRAKGYFALVLTNHIMDDVFERYYRLPDPESRMEHFLKAYRTMREAGQKIGMEVWLGAELNPDRYNKPERIYPVREFLIYGLTENFLRAHPRWYRDSQEEIFRACENEGFLMVQSHPFRRYSEPGDPAYLHGVEIYNANPRSESRNELAKNFADQNGLFGIAGDDFHQYGDEGRAATLVPDTVKTDSDFVNALRNREAWAVRL